MPDFSLNGNPQQEKQSGEDARFCEALREENMSSTEIVVDPERMEEPESEKLRHGPDAYKEGEQDPDGPERIQVTEAPPRPESFSPGCPEMEMQDKGYGGEREDEERGGEDSGADLRCRGRINRHLRGKKPWILTCWRRTQKREPE